MVLFAVVGNHELQAQEEVKSRYGGTFPASVANQPSRVQDKTVLELRDYGIDLFIIGLTITLAAPPAIIILIPLLGRGFIQIGGSIEGDIRLFGVAIGGLFGAIGSALWIIGITNWTHGNQRLRQEITISKGKDSDVLLALDTEINGIGLVLKY